MTITAQSLIYARTIELIADRIRALLPRHPEILTLTDHWDLLKVDGFACDDLSPSSAQAATALRMVQREAQQGAVP